MSPLCLTYTDVNEAYFELQTIKKHFTLEETTRNGPALAFQAPVIITHASPYRRVLFDPVRNANPFFHYMEAIWMLAGSNNVHFPAKFARQIKTYSDNGYSLHGAYGHRWKSHFDLDQLDNVIHQLKTDPTTRRAVLGMWDPKADSESFSKDLPCNTHVYFRVIDRRLTMTVCNRSNDLVWGMLGANMVHMAITQEYIANATKLDVGNYYQITNNLHVYSDWVDKWDQTGWSDWYLENPNFRRWEFGPGTFNFVEAERFVEEGTHTNRPYQCRILRDNAVPMYDAWELYKADDFVQAQHVASRIHDEDWRQGCIEWLIRAEGRHDRQEQQSE